MQNFYKTLLEHPGTNFSQNLQKAKLDLLKTGKFESPYYWAPFILIGY
jgi:CHAT domain-containing protein